MFNFCQCKDKSSLLRKSICVMIRTSTLKFFKLQKENLEKC